MKDNEKQKSNGTFIVIIIMLFLIILGLGGYLIYDKLLKNDNEEHKLNEITEGQKPSETVEKDEITETELSLDSTVVKALSKVVGIYPYGAFSIYSEYFYK